VFVLKAFGRWAKKEEITDATLLETIDGADKGIVDANLGEGVVKLRIAREGQGKSRGFRSIVALKNDDRAFYLDGWAKSDFGNINENHLKLMKQLAHIYFSFDDDALQKVIDGGALREIARQAVAPAAADGAIVEHAHLEAEQTQ